MGSTPNAKAGDRIILYKLDNTYELYMMDGSGERVKVSESVTDLHQAYEIALASIPADGQVWVCYEGTPGELEQY